jgi:hypothetical protein
MLAVVACVAVLAIAIPTLAASPSPSPDESAPGSVDASASSEVSPSPQGSSPSPSVASPSPASPSPLASPEAAEPDDGDDSTATPKGPKPSKGPETSMTLRGTVVKGTDGKGRPSFSMTVDGVTWDLSDGPPWYWGDKDPLMAYVGKTVTVVGTTRGDDHELDVETVDGTALRAPGKPPWAGGPWVVGSMHPGWKPWMADGKPGKGLGRDGAPGQLKKASPPPSS